MNKDNNVNEAIKGKITARGWLLLFCIFLCFIQPTIYIMVSVDNISNEGIRKFFIDYKDWLMLFSIILGVYVGYLLYNIKPLGRKAGIIYFVIAITVRLLFKSQDYIFDKSIFFQNITYHVYTAIFLVGLIYLVKSKKVKLIFSLNTTLESDSENRDHNQIHPVHQGIAMFTKQRLLLAVGATSLLLVGMIYSSTSPSDKVVKQLAKGYLEGMPFGGARDNNDIKILKSFSKDGAIVYVVQCGSMICDMPVIKTNEGWIARGIRCGG